MTRKLLSILLFGAVLVAAFQGARRYLDAHTRPLLIPAPLLSSTKNLVALYAGASSARDTITIVGDYSCAGCRQYERQAGPEIRLLADRKHISYRYIPIPRPGDASAATAARLVLCERRSAQVWRLHESFTDLWSRGHPSVKTVLEVARGLAGDRDVASCVSDTTAAHWVEHDQQALGDLARVGIPAIVVDSVLVRPRRSYREIIQYLDKLR